MDYLSFILSGIGLVCMIAASLVKGQNMKTILALVFLGNALVATSYFIGESGINGAASCYLGALQAIINYYFDKRNMPLPIWLVSLYAVAFVVLNLAVGGFKLLCILAIVASLTFIMCIGQKSGAKYRFWTIVNMLLWCSYDAFSKSFGVLLAMHLPLLIFTVVGMLIHDTKSKNNL